MTTNAVPDNSEIIVSGKDMFGATFSETTHLLFLDKSEFLFSLFRPVAEHQPLRVSFEPQRTNHCIEGFVTRVKNRLGGMQTIEVRVLNGTNRSE
ncbi:MAG: hypothetical protein EXQ58_08835 [Acidobacteria bacterium]|nr:hypothetical protein [Acidobacteriota bacterium]